MKLNVWTVLATGFCTGLSKFAPGTMGSFLGFFPVFAFKQFSLTYHLMAIILLVGAGTYICHRALPFFDRKDPGEIVIDEIATFPLTFVLIPLNYYTLFIGFLLNRVLDITKPPPARQSQDMPGAIGVMIDDFITAIYANFCLQLLITAFPFMRNSIF